MKNYFFIISIFFIAFLACNKSNEKSKTFEITGEITGIAGSNLILMYENPNSPDGFGVDSLITADNKFTFKGEIDSVRVAMITTDNPLLMKMTSAGPIPPTPVQFFIEPDGEIKIHGEVSKMHLSQLSGTKMNEQMNKLIRFVEKQQVLIDSLTLLMYAAEEAGFDTQEFADTVDSEFMRLINMYADFVVNNPSLDISSFVVRMYLSQFYESTEIRKIYNNLSDNVKTNFYGRLILQDINKNQPITAGSMAPAFVLYDMNNNEVKLSDFAGNYLVIDFWASWCGYCRQNHPKLIEIYNKYHYKGLNMVGISGDADEEKWRTAIKEDNLTWTQIYAPLCLGFDIIHLYGINEFPSSVVISPKGKIIGIFSGEDPKFYEFIDSIFSQHTINAK